MEHNHDHHDTIHLKKKYKKGQHPLKFLEADYFVTALVGKPGSGKTNLITYCVQQTVDRYAYVKVLSLAGRINGNYRWITKKLITREYKDGWLDQIAKDQLSLNGEDDSSSDESSGGEGHLDSPPPTDEDIYDGTNIDYRDNSDKEPPPKKSKKQKKELLLILDDIIGVINFQSPEWRRFLMTHRHRRTNIILGIQYLNMVLPPETRAMLTDAAWFRHTLNERNIYGLYSNFGQTGFNDSNEFVEKYVRPIQKHEFVYFHDDADAEELGDVYKFMKAPAPEHIPKFYIELPSESEEEEEEEDEYGYANLYGARIPTVAQAYANVIGAGPVVLYKRT
jgi:hypothetical protein